MENFFPFIFVSICMLILFFSWWFNDDNRLKWELKKSKGIRIADFQEGGYAKVVGRAIEAQETLIAPLSKRKCLFYQLIVEVRKGKNSWDTIIDETKSVDFLVHQDGETVYVDAKNVEGVLVKDVKEDSGFFKAMNSNMKALLKARGIKITGLFDIERTFRYKEGVLEIGEAVAVKGVGNWKKQKAAAPILTLSSSGTHKLKISDHHTTLTEGGIPQATLHVEDAALPEPPKQQQIKEAKLILEEKPLEKYKQYERRYNKNLNML